MGRWIDHAKEVITSETDLAIRDRRREIEVYWKRIADARQTLSKVEQASDGFKSERVRMMAARLRKALAMNAENSVAIEVATGEILNEIRSL
jgi:hypothetical protein